MKGKFITFEGPEGSGKSTHSALLYNYLREKGYAVIHLREPGSTAIGEKIRKILLDRKNRKMDVLVEALLYMASRAQLIKEKIIPALKKGDIVICDRFQDATIVYQGYAAGLDIAFIKNIAKTTTCAITPDLTFLLDIDTKKGLERAGKIKDRMEEKSLSFHRRVRAGYLKLARQNPRRIKIIKVDDKKALTQKQIRNILDGFLCHLKR